MAAPSLSWGGRSGPDISGVPRSRAWSPHPAPSVFGPCKDEARIDQGTDYVLPLSSPVPAPSGLEAEVLGRPAYHIWSSLRREAGESEDINGSSKGLDKYGDDRPAPGY